MMSRQNPPSEPPTGQRKTKPKKMVSRSVAIGLGIVCIILAVSLIGAVSLYKSQTASLNSEVSDLTEIANLDKYTTWVNDTTVTQTANNYTSWSFSARYAGYFSVNVQSSTTNNTYARAIYSSYGVDYDNTITVGTSGTATFPVLPAVLRYMTSSTNARSYFIEIRVGNTNLVNGATENVTITYYY
jgi:hypothetical protein